jgi:hypothetical protein
MLLIHLIPLAFHSFPEAIESDRPPGQSTQVLVFLTFSVVARRLRAVFPILILIFLIFPLD